MHVCACVAWHTRLMVRICSVQQVIVSSMFGRSRVLDVASCSSLSHMSDVMRTAFPAVFGIILRSSFAVCLVYQQCISPSVPSDADISASGCVDDVRCILCMYCIVCGCL